MKKFILVFILTLGLALNGRSQCAFDNFFYTDLTPPAPGTSDSEPCGFGSDLYTTTVVLGETYTFATCGGGPWDSQLTLYDNTGTIVLGYSDDDCGVQSTITWVATYSGVVNLLLDRFNCLDEFTCMAVTVTWVGPPPPPVPNDDCSSIPPTVLTNGVPQTFNGTTLGGTMSPDEAAVLGAGAVWESVTLTGVCNQLTVDYCGSAPGIMDGFVFAIYTDCPLTSFTSAPTLDFTTCGDGNPTYTFFNLPPGTYYLPVLCESGYNATLGAYIMNVLSIDCPPPPVNDDCVNATPVSCGDVASGSTVLATPDPAAPNCAATTGGNGVWYSFTGTGLLQTISLCGSSFDTQLHIYVGGCGALSCVAGNDDFCGVQSQTSVATTLGTPYLIYINGFGGDVGNYTLTLPAPVTSNDDCIGATPILPGITTGTTSCTNPDVAPACGTAADGTGGGVWYSFTPGCSSTLTASLCTGTAFNTQLRVYSGTCGALVCEDGNDDFCGTQSEVSWAGTVGVTYYILVHGSGSDEGAFDLTLTQADATAPVADVDPLLDINSTCEVTLTAPTATDNCAGSITGTTPIMTFSANGTYNITWTYDDGNGNISTEGQQIVINDAIPPTIGCLSDTSLNNDAGICGAVVDYLAPACDFYGPFYDQSFDPAPLDNGYFITSAFPNFIADDFIVPDGDCWNIETFSANIWEQNIGVSLSSLVVNFLADAGGQPGAIISTQTLTSANWTSTYLGTNFGYDMSDFDFTLMTPVNLCGGPGGTTYWISIYDDAAAGADVAWSVLIPVNNYDGQQAGTETGPWAPAGGGGNDFVFNVGGLFVGTVTDNCPTCATVAQTAGLPSGSIFPVGTTTNTFVATDAGGNTATCSFDVVVSDTQAPVPDLDSSAAYTFISTDLPILCPDNLTTLDSILVSVTPTTLNSGDIVSVCLDIDHTWDSDMTISLISPQGTVYALSVANGADQDDYIQTCFDMSAATSINTATAPFIGTYIPEGAGGFDNFNGEDPNGYWKLSIFDAFAGDQGVLYDFRINFDFHWDSILPVLQGGCVNLTAPTATDNCDPTAVIGVTADPTSYTTDGTYIVTWTYTDAFGNSSMQTQEVIVDDVTAPVPDVSSLPIVSGSCTATVGTTPTATDDCNGTITGTTIDVLTYNTAGTYTVNWEYDDGNGNITIQTQTVVVSDNEAPDPDANFLPNFVGNCAVTVDVVPTATDNCGGTISGTTTDATTYDVVGTYFITWTYDDGNGNTVTQNQTVIVNPCLGLQDEAGQWDALIYPNPGSGIFTLTLSTMPEGNTEVRLVNTLGQVIYAGMLQGQVQQFDFSQLASATYYLLITSNNGQISKPVIIRHND